VHKTGFFFEIKFIRKRFYDTTRSTAVFNTSKRLTGHRYNLLIVAAGKSKHLCLNKTASMKKFYLFIPMLCCFYFLLPQQASAQPCVNLTATCTGYESRCAATGSIKINAGGGSGSYKYRTMGPVNTNYTSTDSITGLSAGVYTVQVNDFITNCTVTINNVVVGGIYQDPRFTLNKVDVSCDNGNNGSISLSGQLFGLSPFVYSIAAPSPMGVGTTNSTGIFPNLSAGNYFIRLTDSCGGIQTRQITINNYNWNLVEYPFTKTSCYEASGYIKVEDSRGNISTVSGIPGFMYGIVTAPGDTMWSSSPYFSVPLFGINSFEVIAKDTCGIIKKGVANVSLVPEVGANVSIRNKTCSTFSANLTGVKNFFSPIFCLRDSLNAVIECNMVGNFDNIPYGRYCISAYDICSDTSISRCFTASAPAISIDNNVRISQKTCTDFTASITGQTGLTSPQFCLYDSSNTLISCNNTGVFSGLPYGRYCINLRDGCRDTSILKCFTALRPAPYIAGISPVYVNCRNFGIVVGGDTLSNPRYCLYDSAGNLIVCNSTGIFDSIPLGQYCMNVYDSCYDTTIIRCFTVGPPVIQNDIVIGVQNRTCSTFSITASGASLTNPRYCLYNSADSLIACDSSGQFSNLAYGAYCIKARNTCPDTLMIKCFTESKPIPSVDEAVRISQRTCTGFAAEIWGQYYLTNPQYCLYDSVDSLIRCNTSGLFTNLPYGSYCIKIRNFCYDTTIVRCFTSNPLPMSMIVTGEKSCSFNFAAFDISLNGANFPVSIKIFRPNGTVYSISSFNTNVIHIDSIPGVPAGSYYKIVALDACGNTDSASTGAIASYFNSSINVIPKCPGASWANGSGNIAIAVSTNLGSITTRIIKKDGVTYSAPLVPNTAAAGVYTFTDLGPGTYIMKSNESICSRNIYDTVIIVPYLFPNLSRSSVYQCDQGGFSVSAIATNGVPPFTYEIIGSVPAAPSIVAPPQGSSIFNVNNGFTYSLIRLRALDACGNATLGDASILPLTSYGISASLNCMFYPTTLSVDTILSAGYEWYKKTTAASNDSVLVSSGPAIFIPNLLPSDTGIYICYMDVNGGCIKRTYVYRLTGSCYIVLPVSLQEFKGREENDKHVLYWKTTDEKNLENYVIERQTGSDPFTEIGRVLSRGSQSLQFYQFDDVQPAAGNNYYRLKMTDKNGSFTYSNIVVLQKKSAFGYSLYPNPVKDLLTIRFNTTAARQYTVSLYNLTNQLIFQQKFNTSLSNQIEIQRPPQSQSGVYLLRITDTNSKTQATERIVFL
jgi:hypothetical protein